MAKTMSRTRRWQIAAAQAREAFDELRNIQETLHAALSDLNDIRDEYVEWYENLPESLQDSPVGEKLSEIEQMDFDIEVDLDDYEEPIDAAENADLPLGFGRD